MNVADLGTRPASVAEIAPDSTWQQGQDWMRLPRTQMPLRTAAEVTLTAEEARVAAAELRAADVRGHKVHLLSSLQQLSCGPLSERLEKIRPDHGYCAVFCQEMQSCHS
jgi:hypothetical protein